MTAASTTLAGRRAAEALMVDACTISLPAAGGSFDTDTGTYAPGAPTALYTGKCRVRHAGGQSGDRQVQHGEQQISLWPFVVSVPTSVVGLRPDAVVTITASALDPDLVGLVLRVRDVIQGSHVTARRLGCEVNAG